MSGHFQPLTPVRVLRKLKKLSLPKEGQQYVINRNPRNLEKLRVAYKPNGYLLEKPGRSYWHKLELNITNRYISAEVKHFENGPVVTASSSEWAIKKQLFKTNDASAYINTARVFAQRCLRSGITEIMCKIETYMTYGNSTTTSPK
ncbi:39S ribosomal protein L18, mitochondrial-like [Teleopsis dalmanni]|uniref:39S ribosomal protein L18, mitochondrial-like n=1 Tax=Teleopsis dalmanni TaxID=139649 RepID=UPI0018CEE2A4|nr:39S ribosomal protein L18, mitochondrial-like [Teleopsis dalmanni]